MYTMMPYRSNRNIARRNTSFFNDPFFGQLFDMGDWFGSGAFRVDIKDKGDNFELQAELPGVKQDQIELNIDEDTLTISADFKKEAKDETENYVYSERRSGKYQRSFDLTGIDKEHITADYEDGVLKVMLPKEKPEEKPVTSRKIEIGHKEN